MREYLRVEVTSRNQWREWLAENHARSGPVWLVTFKKSASSAELAAKHVAYAEVVEEALCFGWVDSVPRKLDADRGMLLMSPRRAGSPWSGLNKRRVGALIEAGLMTAAGLAKVEAAKADGSWVSYDVAETLEVPADLAAALKAAGKMAEENFARFAPSSRKGILWWIASSKQEATRARRVSETARLAKVGLRANFPESKGK
jgi:uncharacterized protein YdeI (YjbR/CyaY-like superfamily)